MPLYHPSSLTRYTRDGMARYPLTTTTTNQLLLCFYQDRLGSSSKLFWAMTVMFLPQEIFGPSSAYEYLDSPIARHPTLCPPDSVDTVDHLKDIPNKNH
ncbi:hypothetical protein O0I10_010202 [Lichtheimia ornata]|uniref:Uncharacterized protein n=1 Tax=Lichtheimia ornata TaxID=688661 RepID=A0AAD7XY13_9FUNG|nr:uncharacterized protein O0I10_010202 [Lichtheimia ornata]KAJ8654127.1 hypothetical protein O0I10_010202 [Lichtheimia ornata]